MNAAPNEATRLLDDAAAGDGRALERLMPLVYDELRRIAAGYLRRERGGHTLQPTALVHEAYMRLIDQRVRWQSRAHFLGIAAQLMRRILVDYARSRHADKRGGGFALVALDDVMLAPYERDVELCTLDDALQALSALDPQQARVVELRFFGGLSIEETAEVLGVSATTVSRDWAVAKTWLRREISRGEDA